MEKVANPISPWLTVYKKMIWGSVLKENIEKYVKFWMTSPMSIFFRGDIFSFSYFKQAYCSSTFEVWTTLNLYIWSVENTVGGWISAKSGTSKIDQNVANTYWWKFWPQNGLWRRQTTLFTHLFWFWNRILSSQTLKLKQN